MGGEEATGRPADRAGQHPQDRNAEEVSAARRALRPGAAGLKGSDAHPIAGVKRYSSAIGPAQPWPDLRSSEEPQSALRIGRLARQRRPASPIITRMSRNPSGVRSERSGDRAAVPQGGAKPLCPTCLYGHFDYILIGLIAGDKHGYRDEGIDGARPPGARRKG